MVDPLPVQEMDLGEPISFFEFDDSYNNEFRAPIFNLTNDEDTFIDDILDNIGDEPQNNEDSQINTELIKQPMEDFLDLNDAINDLDDTAFDDLFNDVLNCDVIQPAIEFVSEITPVNSCADINDFSGQSSPSIGEETQKGFKDILDSILESDFMMASTNPCTEDYVNCTSSTSSEIEVLESLLSSSDSDSAFTNANDVLMPASRCKRRLAMDEEEEQSAKKAREGEDAIVPLSEIVFMEADKTSLRRIKNNVASKQTRAKRKQRQQDLFVKATELEKSNAGLKIQIEMMQKQANELRELLVAKLSNAN